MGTWIAMLVGAGLAAASGSALAAIPDAAAAPTPATGLVTASGAYADVGAKACQQAATCFFTMSPIPSGKVLTLTQVSCYLQVKGPGSVYYLALLGSSLNTYLKPVLLATYAGTKQYVSNDPALAIFKAGQMPSIIIETTATETTVAGHCTIGGQLH